MLEEKKKKLKNFQKEGPVQIDATGRSSELRKEMDALNLAIETALVTLVETVSLKW